MEEVTIRISHKPTFDLTEFTLEHFDEENRLGFFRSKQIFKFDCVYGFLTTRSRVTRIDRHESNYVEQIISATIDAGYQGHLVWKIKLTNKGIETLREMQEEGKSELLTHFRDCQQIHLFPATAGNYYNGTNQTQLQPEIIFTL